MTAKAADFAGHVCRRAERIQPLRLMQLCINVVAAEKFIPAVAGQRHRDLLSRKTAHQHRRDLARVRKGFVKIPRNTLHKIEHILLPDFHGRMVGSQMCRDLLRERRLVIGRLIKPDAKRLQRPARLLHRQILRDRGDQRRVISARQKGAKRHIRDHPLAHRVPKLRAQPLLRLAIILDRIRGFCMIDFRDIPVPVKLYGCLRQTGFCRIACQRHLHPAARLQLVRVRENRIRRIDVPLIKIPRQHILAQISRKTRRRHQRLKLRAEHQTAVIKRVIKRLLPDPVPQKIHRLLLPVKQRDGEHPAQMIHHPDAPPEIRRQNHLRVA